MKVQGSSKWDCASKTATTRCSKSRGLAHSPRKEQDPQDSAAHFSFILYIILHYRPQSVHTYMRTHIHTFYVSVCVVVFKYKHMYVYVCTHVYMYIHMYVCMCVYIYIYIWCWRMHAWGSSPTHLSFPASFDRSSSSGSSSWECLWAQSKLAVVKVMAPLMRSATYIHTYIHIHTHICTQGNPFILFIQATLIVTITSSPKSIIFGMHA